MNRKSAQALNVKWWILPLLLTFAVPLPFSQIANAQSSVPNVSNRTPRQILVSVPDRMLAVIEGGKVIRTTSPGLCDVSRLVRLQTTHIR